MKKILLIHLTFFIYSITFAQWSNQTSGTTEHLNEIQMLNIDTGYIVGNNGTILKTIDGGNTWINLNLNYDEDFKNLFFINANTGFISSDSNMLKTTDGGNSWVDLNFPAKGIPATDIHFFNSNIGLATSTNFGPTVTDPREGIFRTTDGGLNWIKVNTNPVRKISFASDLIGYAFLKTKILKTIDGGVTWQEIYDTQAFFGMDIFCTSDTTAFFACNYYDAIFSTNDAGKTIIQGTTGYGATSIYFPSYSTGYALLGEVMKTTDAGLTWDPSYYVNTSFEIGLNDLFFTSNSVGWVVGDSGTILSHLPTIVGNNNTTICANESIEINGTTYDANNPNGTEIFTNVGPNNSDSMVTVALNVSATIDVSTSTNGFSISANQTGATYQWIDCGNNNTAIQGETSATFIAQNDGDYAVVVNVGTCSDTSSCVTTINTGIEDINTLTGVKIYPNPINDLFSIELDENYEKIQITILSVEGKIVYTNSISNSNKLTIDSNEWSKGIYVVRISSNENIKTLKLTK